MATRIISSMEYFSMAFHGNHKQILTKEDKPLENFQPRSEGWTIIIQKQQPALVPHKRKGSCIWIFLGKNNIQIRLFSTKLKFKL